MPWPLIGCSTGTTAASVHRWQVVRAPSTSAVPILCPLTLMTSSTRPAVHGAAVKTSGNILCPLTLIRHDSRGLQCKAAAARTSGNAVWQCRMKQYQEPYSIPLSAGRHAQRDSCADGLGPFADRYAPESQSRQRNPYMTYEFAALEIAGTAAAKPQS